MITLLDATAAALKAMEAEPHATAELVNKARTLRAALERQVEPVASPYPEGSPREAWRRGYNGETNFGAKGSDYDRQYQEGKRARTAAPAAQPEQEPVANDTKRLDFMDANPTLMLRNHKKRWALVGHTSYEYDTHKTLREAIDAAIAQARKATCEECCPAAPATQTLNIVSSYKCDLDAVRRDEKEKSEAWIKQNLLEESSLETKRGEK